MGKEEIPLADGTANIASETHIDCTVEAFQRWCGGGRPTCICGRRHNEFELVFGELRKKVGAAIGQDLGGGAVVADDMMVKDVSDGRCSGVRGSKQDRLTTRRWAPWCPS